MRDHRGERAVGGEGTVGDEGAVRAEGDGVAPADLRASEPEPRSSQTVEIVARRARRPWVIEIQDEGDARRILLADGEVVVGAAPPADVRLRDATVSARHCVLEPRDAGVAVRDLGSRNGTYVGPARIDHASAGPGTMITVGRSTIVIGEVEADDDGGALGPPLPGIAGASIAMRRIAAEVRRLARYADPVFIAGETGTGKELIARALHAEGPRASRPMVVINVAALPRGLVESELFGHERGAFTGAMSRRAGAFAEADGGTLFLDEIGDLPMEAQPTLLRALEGYEVRAVGSTGSGRRLDVRVVAASHAALSAKVERGEFRRDLFHRLTYIIDVPPLRERRGDIAVIAQKILDEVRGTMGPRSLSSGALARLATHDFPGNVRELRNVLKRAAHFADGLIHAADVERALRGRASEPPRAALNPGLAKALLAAHGQNMSAAARAAGYPRTSFRKILNE